jgi:hypothetical protein
MDLFAEFEPGQPQSHLSPLAFFAILAGLFALWAFLIRRFYPPRKR